jgi:uncharacterized membrane protein
LIVVTFDDGGMAKTVYGALQAMNKGPILGLVDSVMVTKGGAGQVRLHPEAQAGTGLAGLLGDLIFRSSERTVPAVTEEKLDSSFVGTVRSALRNNGSAVLFFLHPDSLSDRGELLNALSLFRGTIHQTTLSSRSEAILQSML